MWGNRQGWIISIALVLVISSALTLLAHWSSISAPTGPALDPSNLAPLALPISPEDACPIFTQDADAAPAYAKTIASWTDGADEDAQHFVESPHGPLPSPFQPLLDARNCNRMTLFSTDLPSLVNYDSEHPALEKLFAAGQAVSRAGLSLSLHNRAEDATACLQAAFALGRNLYRQRVVFDECQKGMQLMADSAASMCQFLPHDSPQWIRLNAFLTEMDDYQTRRMLPIWQVISSVDQQTIDQTAGDVLAFAQRSAEPMWRVEACLKLGRYRYNAGSLGDQVGAAAALRQLTTDPNPAVAAAARAGLALDLQTYRMIH